MSRTANLSPMGLYNWDNTIFDLMVIPNALDRNTLIDNLLLETAELELLYPNPVTLKHAIGMWSAKELDVWNRLYKTTQYIYNPIENYDKIETGTESGAGSTVHSGTDTTTETETQSGADGRTHDITHGGSDSVTISKEEGGTQSTVRDGTTADSGTEGVTESKTEGGTQVLSMARSQGGSETESGTSSVTLGGSDTTSGTETRGHWVAGYDAPAATPQNDGLVKQTRDETDNSTTTAYGKTEAGTSSKTTNFGKTEANADTTNFGKTEDNNQTITYGKQVDTDITDTTNFGKTEDNTEETAYGKTENHDETITYGKNTDKSESVIHGETINEDTTREHTLHGHGNIGVKTTQSLIAEQREIEKFNLYDYIIDSFKMRFCILVY